MIACGLLYWACVMNFCLKWPLRRSKKHFFGGFQVGKLFGCSLCQNGCVIIILTNIWGKDLCKLSLCEYFSGPECQMGREACRKSKATLWSRLGLLGRDFRSPRRCRCSTPWSEHSSENKVRSEYGMENKVWSEYSSENKVRYEYSMENKVRSKYGSENKYVVMTCSLLLLTTPPFLTTKV